MGGILPSTSSNKDSLLFGTMAPQIIGEPEPDKEDKKSSRRKKNVVNPSPVGTGLLSGKLR